MQAGAHLARPARASVLDELGRSAEALAVLAALAGDPAANLGELAEARWRAFEARRTVGDRAWADDALALLRLTPGSGRAQQALDALDASSVPVAPLRGAYVRYLAHEAATAANSYEAAHDASTASAAQQAVASFYLAAIAERAGDIEGALAAYNGGPANARRWREQQRWSGSDGYVAAVDFAETRLYLERVLANYEWYRYYHGAAPGPAIR